MGPRPVGLLKKLVFSATECQVAPLGFDGHQAAQIEMLGLHRSTSFVYQYGLKSQEDSCLMLNGLPGYAMKLTGLQHFLQPSFGH